LAGGSATGAARAHKTAGTVVAKGVVPITIGFNC